MNYYFGIVNIESGQNLLFVHIPILIYYNYFEASQLIHYSIYYPVKRYI